MKTGIYLNKEGLTVLDSDSDDEPSPDAVVSWDELFSWAMASSQEEGDVEVIIDGLKGVANRLQKWSDSFQNHE